MFMLRAKLVTMWLSLRSLRSLARPGCHPEHGLLLSYDTFPRPFRSYTNVHQWIVGRKEGRKVTLDHTSRMKMETNIVIQPGVFRG